MKKRSLNNRGFSLVELIVAVLIIAIISSGAIVAFGSAWGMKAEGAARSLSDAMKQARSAALGRKNEVYISETESKRYTDVYAKIYSGDGNVYVDICATTEGKSENETVLRKQTIASDYYKVQFIDKDDNVFAQVGDDTVYVYFLKSTGGVASVTKGEGKTGNFGNNIQKIKIADVTGGEYQDIILVSLTGRCYVDRETSVSGEESESGGGL